MTGAQDCHGRAVDTGSDISPKEIGEGDKGDTILSRRRAAALIWVWSEAVAGRGNQEAGWKGRPTVRIQNGLPV
jgi:hypothetical protein